MEQVQKNVAPQATIEIEQEFTAGYRWQHWIRALSIVVLIVTGFYLAEPFMAPISNGEPTNFMQALFRFWHIVFGFLMISAVIYKSYLFVFGRKHKNERVSFWDVLNPVIWGKQMCYYLFVCKHPHLKGAYNPLQFAAYALFYVMMLILIVTGLILYINVYHNGLGAFMYEPMRQLEAMLGGLAWVRQLHHIVMWGVMIFMAIHIYLAIFNSIWGKEGGMDAIFSGQKWHKKH
ncbi:Quinone-reactive Ni/Fe hydrogenase, cytochrome b subunit [hydrothermal vent metagenome]|uniref:Quinone-reactive Ni/Fe hydrogenase, cytochrome b subunit n=1 Tax=hydrothermal vent metagenome TaxID=652676 RepID=A0A1W1ECW3_9ZZZZ